MYIKLFPISRDVKYHFKWYMLHRFPKIQGIFSAWSDLGCQWRGCEGSCLITLKWLFSSRFLGVCGGYLKLELCKLLQQCTNNKQQAPLFQLSSCIKIWGVHGADTFIEGNFHWHWVSVQLFACWASTISHFYSLLCWC